MPIYDYACSTCGHQMEVLHGVHAHGPRICPNCGGPMRKLFAPPAIHFKGSGWAKKDRGGSQHRATKSSSPTEGDGEGGSTSGGSSSEASTTTTATEPAAAD